MCKNKENGKISQEILPYDIDGGQVQKQQHKLETTLKCLIAGRGGGGG